VMMALMIFKSVLSAFSLIPVMSLRDVSDVFHVLNDCMHVFPVHDVLDDCTNCL
jgi:hypothetical protein